MVEDDPAVSRTMLRALRTAGYHVTTARSMAEARASRSFDVAVLDIELGDGNGLDLADELLASGRVRAVVFHSATDDPAVKGHARQLGSLVHKSADTSALLDAVAQALA